ncbi:replication factor C large subunit [Candidatus Woesearchaeota archaeon]|nr:replication factor C large subunit [Candidatus Woesearchaeota archaeon]
MPPLIKKFSPKNIKEIIGQDEAIKQLHEYILSYKRQKKKAALLYGPTGTGKTSSAHALAKELNLEIYELNASDFRNKEQINQKLGAAINQHSLFSKGKLILVDEIDGLSGRKDRGAVQEVIRLMEKSTFPVILTIENPYDHKYSKIRSKAIMIEYNPVEVKDIAAHLEKIVKKEKLSIKEDVLKSIARKAGGDLRAAINDLEILSSLKDITLKSLEDLGMREKEDTIINALIKIFKTTDPKIAIRAFDTVNEDFNQRMLWLDANLPKEYERPEDLARAYDKLSKADIFNRRIRRWQHWRFLVYINALITAGIAVSKDKKYEKFVQYKPTGRILKLWWAKQKSMKKRAIAERIAHLTHTSIKRAIHTIPYFQAMYKKDPMENLTDYLELDKEQVAWLRK